MLIFHNRFSLLERLIRKEFNSFLSSSTISSTGLNLLLFTRPPVYVGEKNATFRLSSNEITLHKYTQINKDLNKLHDALGTSMSSIQEVMSIAKNQKLELANLSEKMSFLLPVL
jgi:hypothetical protein